MERKALRSTCRGYDGGASVKVLREVIDRSPVTLFAFWLAANLALLSASPIEALRSGGLLFLCLRGYAVLCALLFVERRKLRLGAWAWAAYLAGFLLVDTVTWWVRWHEGLFSARLIILSSLAAWSLAGGARVALGNKANLGLRAIAVRLGAGLLAAAGWLSFVVSIELGPSRVEYLVMKALGSSQDRPAEGVMGPGASFRRTDDWSYWRALVNDSGSLDAAVLERAVAGSADPRQEARLLWLGFQAFPDRFEPLLAQCLGADEVPLRIVAVQMLGLYRFARYADRLRAAIEDTSPHVAVAACEVLALRTPEESERQVLLERRRNLLNAGNIFDPPPSRVPPLGVHEVHVRIARRKLAEIHEQVRGETIPELATPCLYSIDSGPFRQGSFRLRGLTDVHMREDAKSYKLVLDRFDPIGWRSLNMNSLRSDSELEDLLQARIYGQVAGIPYYRVGVARLTINGRYAGLRYLVENHDEAFQVAWGLPPGNLYREEVGINFSRYNWDDPSYFQGAWKNKARNTDTSMLDLVNAHRVLNTVPADIFPEYARLVWDEEAVLDWYALTVLVGNLHQNIHNVMWYSNASTGRIRQLPMDVYNFDMAPSINMAPSLLYARWLPDPEWNHRKNLRVRDFLRRIRDEGYLENVYREEIDRLARELSWEASLHSERHGYFALRSREEILARYRALWSEHAAYFDSALSVRPALALATDQGDLVLEAASAVQFRLVEIAPRGQPAVPMNAAYRPRFRDDFVMSRRSYYAGQPSLAPRVQKIPLGTLRVSPGSTVRITVENEVLERREVIELVVR